MRIRIYFAIASVLAMLVCVSSSNAENYGGIEFPNGELSFADEVIRYDPTYDGGPFVNNPQAAIGFPDTPPGGDASGGQCVSLGQGGLIELAFTNNYLLNDGDMLPDLHIFEKGAGIEDTFVAIRPTPQTEVLLGSDYDADGDGFYEIGKVYGATSSIDIDSFFPGHAPYTLLFDAIQLIDDQNQGGPSGADIDAVGASSIPEPTTILLLGLGGMAVLRKRK